MCYAARSFIKWRRSLPLRTLRNLSVLCKILHAKLVERRLRLNKSMPERIGLIAGNGTFPLLVLDAARAQGFDVIVAAIKEEAFPEIEQHGAAAVHWLSLGELSKLIETFQRKASAAPSWRDKSSTSRFSPAFVLTGGWPSCCSRWARETPIRCLERWPRSWPKKASRWRIQPHFWNHCWRRQEFSPERAPTEQERKNIDYGRTVARQLAQYDIGQTVVVAESAVCGGRGHGRHRRCH